VTTKPVPWATTGLLDFDGGRQLAFLVSTQAAPFQRIDWVGSKGRIEIEIPFNAPQNRPTRCAIDASGLPCRAGMRVVTVPVADPYQLQAEAFSHAVRSERPDAAGLADACWSMRIVDALFASEKSARLEQP